MTTISALIIDYALLLSNSRFIEVYWQDTTPALGLPQTQRLYKMLAKRAFGNSLNNVHRDATGPQTHLKPALQTLKRPFADNLAPNQDYPKKPRPDLSEHDPENKPSVHHKDPIEKPKQIGVKARDVERKESTKIDAPEDSKGEQEKPFDPTRTIENHVSKLKISQRDRATLEGRKLFTEDDPSVRTIDFYDPSSYYEPPSQLPNDIEDFDKSQLKDINSEPHYAQDIFLYYKEKEVVHASRKYLTTGVEITKMMRSVLVDWMVEVQESFELNHETLYLAVKIVDHYCMKKAINKKSYQLLGATAMLIAAKFDVSYNATSQCLKLSS